MICGIFAPLRHDRVNKHHLSVYKRNRYMNTVKLILVAALSAMTLLPATAQKSKLQGADDSLSYALGVANYKYYVGDSININVKLFSKGMNDASKEKPLMNDSTATAFIVSYMQKRERARLMAEYADQIEAARTWLATNTAAEGVITTASGLQYKVIREGTGATPGPEDMVKVHYAGKTTDGKQFDSSYDRGEPAEFRVNNVIRGWVEGLQLMKEGSKMMLYIPYDLAYGERGAGNIIKPFETLIFEVELLEVIKDK